MNLSPPASLLKAYIHLRVPGVLPLAPMRYSPQLKEFACVGLSIGAFVMRPGGARGNNKACRPQNKCLMAALAFDLERRGGCVAAGGSKEDDGCGFVNASAFGKKVKVEAKRRLRRWGFGDDVS